MKLNKAEFYHRVQELAADFARRYTDSSPMFPWYFVIREDERSFDSHVHLCSFQAYEDSSNGYQNIEGPLNGMDEVTWYADVTEQDDSVRDMFAAYQREYEFVYNDDEDDE